MRKIFCYQKTILFLMLTGVAWAAFCAAMTATEATAQVVLVNDARKRISPRSKKTYVDLVKTVFPDALAYQITIAEQNKPNRTGYRIDAQRSIPLRSLFGRFEGVSFEGLMVIENLNAVRLQTPEGERLLLLMTVLPVHVLKASALSDEESVSGKKETSPPIAVPSPPPVEQEVKKNVEKAAAGIREADYTNVLALFRLTPQPVLLDAADVYRDTNEISYVYFSDIYPHLEIRARQDGFFIINEIDRREKKENSFLYSLLTASGERLQMLSGDALQIDTSDGCGVSSEGTAIFEVGDERARNEYRPIKIERVTKYASRAADCKTITGRFKKTTVFDLIWNKTKSKYETLNVNPLLPPKDPLRPSGKSKKK